MASVYVTKRVIIHPKTMQPPKIMKLSNLDRQCPTLMYLVFFYKPCHDHIYSNISDNDFVFSSLKDSLEDTLSLWYPATGRLSRNPNDGKLDLWCNNGGAIMVEAMTNAQISDLGNLSHYNEFFENLVYKPVFNGNIEEMPLLVAQVTKFGCGGYSIGVGISHALFDGHATFNFLCAWASKAHSKQGKLGLIEWHKPMHKREKLLLINSTNYQIGPKNGALINNVAAIQHLYQLITQQASNSSAGFLKSTQVFVPDLTHNQDCVLKTFHVSSLMIDSLKRKIYGLSNVSSSCSSFEIVAAHLWKARTKALGLRRDKMVCLQFSVDTRTRLVPQLSQGFTGNAYVLASVALSVAELEAATYETLITKIKAAKNSVDNDYVSTYLEALEGSTGAALPPLRELTMVSDWTRTPYHRLNFINHIGQVAANCHVCPLVPPIPQVAYFMQSPIEDKGIDVRIGLSPQIVSAFSHYFFKTLG